MAAGVAVADAQVLAAARELLAARGLREPGSPACARPDWWGELLVGGARPVIAVATTGADAVACAAQTQAAQAAGADLVELRADLLAACSAAVAPEALARETLRVVEAVTATTAAVTAGGAVGGAGGMLPVLLTFRTGAEGGGLAVDDAAYAALLGAVLAGLARGVTAVAAVDVELARGCLPQIARQAAAQGIAVVGSSHDFQQVPPDAVLLERLRQMQAGGAQVAKIAVMPAEPEEVVRLLALTVQARAELEVPVVVIGMGELGAITRLQGWRMGSALSFATAGACASAPGQLPVAVVRAAATASGTGVGDAQA